MRHYSKLVLLIAALFMANSGMALANSYEPALASEYVLLFIFLVVILVLYVVFHFKRQILIRWYAHNGRMSKSFLYHAIALYYENLHFEEISDGKKITSSIWA